MEKLQRKYAAASRTLAAQSRMLSHLRDTVVQREADHAASQVGQLHARLGLMRASTPIGLHLWAPQHQTSRLKYVRGSS